MVLGGEWLTQKVTVGENTALLVDAEVHRLVSKSFERVRTRLQDKTPEW